MVGLGGLEPPASPLSGVRSNHLSYRPMEIEPPEPTPGCLELGSKRLFVKSPHMDVRSCSSRNGLRVKYQVSCVDVLRGELATVFLERR